MDIKRNTISRIPDTNTLEEILSVGIGKENRSVRIVQTKVIYTEEDAEYAGDLALSAWGWLSNESSKLYNETHKVIKSISDFDSLQKKINAEISNANKATKYANTIATTPLTAYNIAKSLDNSTGSERDWLVSLKGSIGFTGPTGYHGYPGDRGATGPQSHEEGPKGPCGIDGDEGPMGPDGREGLQGPPGYPGDRGVEGPKGLKGLNGYQGDKGVSGDCIEEI